MGVLGLNIHFDHGTTIEMNIEAKYTHGHHSVFNYLKHTAIMNPYARVVLREPDGNKVEFPRVSRELPKKSKEIKPHPHGVELGVMMRMIENSSARTITSFLQNEFTDRILDTGYFNRSYDIFVEDLVEGDEIVGDGYQVRPFEVDHGINAFGFSFEEESSKKANKDKMKELELENSPKI
ncbi:DNA topoisomerase VI subunit B, partial [Candidatus Haloredivivus sp. G17]